MSTETTEAPQTHEEKYPECTRMSAVAKESNAIGAFVDWMNSEGWSFMRETTDEEKAQAYNEGECAEPCQYCHTPMEKLLAQYYEIDLNKVEKERQAMLEELCKANEA